jgi:hypothetical protein
METSVFNALTVVDNHAAAVALGIGTKFLFSDNPAGGKNSQQNRTLAAGMNRVTYHERIDQEKAHGTYGTMTTRHSASFGLDMVYPGPYPGLGYWAYAIKSDILT